MRRLLALGNQIVVLGEGHAVAKLESTGTDDAVTGFQTRFDGDEITSRLAGFDNLLAHDESRFLTDHLGSGFNDIDRIAIWLAENGGSRNHQNRLLLRKQNFNFCEHARTQCFIWIIESRADANASSGGVQVRVEGEQRAVKVSVRIGIGRESDLHARFEMSKFLLGQRKVGIDGSERLEGDDGFSSIEILAKIDLAKAELTCKRGAKGFLFNNGPSAIGIGDRLFPHSIARIKIRLSTALLGSQ